MRPVLVLQHASWERPGLIAHALAGAPLEVHAVAAAADPELPAAADLSGLVVMGGPQDADDDAAWPGLAAERRLLADAVDAGVPTLAVCLGMQLLATALGGRLHRRHGTETGFGEIEVVGQDDVLAPLGARPSVLHWHADAVDLPDGATLLAGNAVTPVQAFRAGSALGLQFHLEVEPALLSEWLATPAMTRELTAEQVARIREDAARHLPPLQEAARAGLSTFARAVRDRG